MNVQTLSQWQFAVTCIYHFFFVPLTLGLSVLIAIMETIYVQTGQQVYKAMVKFWGKLFLINFAMGVVTGIVMEFQFGMNWSEYSRYVGDIFGAPLAIEALLAFFLESTFLGIWVFGWDKLSKRMHAAAIWLVAIGSNVSALWILIANSFMQQPQGFALEGGRAVMTDFGALLTNPNVWVQFPHVVTSGLVTGSFFVLGISAYHLVRKHQPDIFQRSFRVATILSAIAILLVLMIGHSQMQHMVRVQPMKVAAAEALWNRANPASLSLFTIGDEQNRRDVWAIRIPRLLSILSFNSLDGEVMGINDLQAEYEAKYGPGDYVPSVILAYWTFRGMVGAGMAMLLIAFYALYNVMRSRPLPQVKYLGLFPLAIALPYIANTTGWMLTEMGRQPWMVFGLLKTEQSYSSSLSVGQVLTTLILFTLLYGVLMVADAYLLAKYARAGVVETRLVRKGERTVAEETYWE